MLTEGYPADRYLDYDAVERHVRALAARSADWASLQTLGESREGRPILLLTLGDRRSGDPETRPALWLDGGTHAVEWTSVMSTLHTATRWLDGLLEGDPALVEAFRRHTVYVVPCVSPDGLQHTVNGAPFFRSTRRPPRPGAVRIGLEPADIDGDGEVRFMRWRHPAGPFVPDGDHPVLMRPRTVTDDPADAWFYCAEGTFLEWDGVRWVQAPREFGLDLNRNYPVDWSPFSMFGMDAGAFPGSEPESRALLDAVAARPHIAAAITNHTYTGCLLTPPGRKDTPLGAGDVGMMKRLAHDLTAGTGYRTFAVYPEFMYDPDKPIIGTWDDTLSAVFGICAYTLELWDPFAWAGLPPADPMAMFRDPDQARIRAVVDKAVAEGLSRPWQRFDHPQLGEVEIGGVIYRKTVRNPPEPLLADECARGFTVADRLRRALPDVRAAVHVEPLGDGARRVRLVLENQGALPSSGLEHAVSIGASPPVRALLTGAELVSGEALQEVPHLDGWMQEGFARNPLYPRLPARGHRAVASWVTGPGDASIEWWAGRGGRGTVGVPSA